MYVPPKKRYKLTSDAGLSTRATLPPHLVQNGVEPMSSIHASSRRGDATVKGKKQGERGSTRNEERPTLRREVAVAKLRLYLAQRMLQAVRCSPNGGFGVPVDCVRQEMAKEFGSDLVDGLFGEASANAVILSECGDVVELMPLRVQQLTKNGCVPSVQFRRDSTNMEARIREESLAIISRAEEEEEIWRIHRPHIIPSSNRLETGVENRLPETNPPHLPQVVIALYASTENLFQRKGLVEGLLHQRVRHVLREMMSEVLTEGSRFPSTLDFVERFKKIVGTDLDPLASGFPSVLEMLQNMNLEDLVWFTEYDGTMYLVPSSQAYNKYCSEANLEGRDPSQTKIPREIPPPPPRPEEATGKTTAEHTTGPVKRNHELHPSSAPIGSSGEEELDEFDVEILIKLRNVFEQTVCKDRKPISLNRLPLIFLRRCGSVLDYQKYGFINLADVVALLDDLVKVTDSEKGKIIVPIEKPKALASHTQPVTTSTQVPMSLPDSSSSQMFATTPSVTTISHGHGTIVTATPVSGSMDNHPTGPSVSPGTASWSPVELMSVHPTRWATVYPGSHSVSAAQYRSGAVPPGTVTRADPHTSHREYRA